METSIHAFSAEYVHDLRAEVQSLRAEVMGLHEHLAHARMDPASTDVIARHAMLETRAIRAELQALQANVAHMAQSR